MRFLGRKQREEDQQPRPPAILSSMTDEDSDYGPVPPPPPPALSKDEDEENMIPDKTDPPQDDTQEMSIDHYQEESNEQETSSGSDEEDVSHEYDDEAENKKFIDDDTSVEIPPTDVVQRMIDTDTEGEQYIGEKSSRSGLPYIAAAVCCLGILAVVLGSGFGTGAFLRSKSQSSPGGGGKEINGTIGGNNGGNKDAGATTTESDRLNKVSTLLLTQSKDDDVLREVTSAENKAMTWLATTDTAQLNPETDTQRLVQRYVLASLFYKSDRAWTNSAGWLENPNECQWSGVTCETLDVDGVPFDAVAKIDLQSNGLNGGLPVDLSLLTNLKSLYLGGNAITQDVGAIQWSGMILEDVSLFSNQLSGDVSALGPIGATLFLLDLSRNKFVGALPDLSALALLQELHIQDNGFTGEIPDKLASLPLKRLYLGDNAWTGGPIPVFLYTMTQLQVLSLPRSQRSQSISGAIGTLVNLKVLDLAGNAITGTLPAPFLALGSITEFTAPANQLTGELPDFSSWGSLVTLDLEENDFTGALPEDIGGLVNLQTLRLSRNALSGSFPSSTTSLVNMQLLDVARNRMTGELPSDIGALVNLRELVLSANLTPDVSGFSGTLPDSLGNLKMLERLEIRSNAFTGTIPTALQSLEAIKYLDLRFNGFSGTIPTELSFLVDTAFEVYFQGNRLEGAVPTGICGVAVLEADCTLECSCCTTCARRL